jgi:hypothetical protein
MDPRGQSLLDGQLQRWELKAAFRRDLAWCTTSRGAAPSRPSRTGSAGGDGRAVAAISSGPLDQPVPPAAWASGLRFEWFAWAGPIVPGYVRFVVRRAVCNGRAWQHTSRRPTNRRLGHRAVVAAGPPLRPGDLRRNASLSAPPRLGAASRSVKASQTHDQAACRRHAAPALGRRGRAGVRPSSGRTPAPRGRPRLVGGSRPRGGRQPSRGAAASRAPAVAWPVQDGRARRMTATPLVERPSPACALRSRADLAAGGAPSPRPAPFNSRRADVG